MLAGFGLALISGMTLSAVQPASIRIDLVAEVPVTCSSGAILQMAETGQGLEASIAGTCNTTHLVRVVMPHQVSKRARATLNGLAGSHDQRSFTFERSAYFSQASLLRIDLEDDEPRPDVLTIEISPI